MAQSAELRKQMIKELQTRTVRFENDKENETRTLPSRIDTARVHSLTSRPEGKKLDERASLVMIKVNIGLGDRKLWVNAIVDSGSEVNIISRAVAKELNKDYPVMPLEEARCADANGNQGVLTGKFSEVLLFQGSVVTNAALFVGSYKVNFQMLLGRPWIRGNMVSMKVKGRWYVPRLQRSLQHWQADGIIGSTRTLGHSNGRTRTLVLCRARRIRVRRLMATTRW